jgi:hypothetical protein
VAEDDQGDLVHPTAALCQCYQGFQGAACDTVVGGALNGGGANATVLSSPAVQGIVAVVCVLLVVAGVAVVAYCKTRRELDKIKKPLMKTRQKKKGGRHLVATEEDAMEGGHEDNEGKVADSDSEEGEDIGVRYGSAVTDANQGTEMTEVAVVLK